MRELTRSIAIDRDAGRRSALRQIASFFDSLASGWRERDVPERHAALADAVARGGSFPSGWCVEIGSGTGNTTADLRGVFQDVVSVELSREMLRLASVVERPIQADGAALPLRTGSAAVVALINMFLFPVEVARVLAEDGVLLWVSTNGDQTPIYLPPAEVLNVLPGTWDGISLRGRLGNVADRTPDHAKSRRVLKRARRQPGAPSDRSAVSCDDEPAVAVGRWSIAPVVSSRSAARSVFARTGRRRSHWAWCLRSWLPRDDRRGA